MGDGTKENPYTREDVLRLIGENGGKAKGLDLSGKVFKDRIDLSGLDLSGIILRSTNFAPIVYGAAIRLSISNDKGKPVHDSGPLVPGYSTDGAKFDNSDLCNADLRKAILNYFSCRGTMLNSAKFEGTTLSNTELTSAKGWEDIDWGNYIIGEEHDKDYNNAILIYRHLKVWYTNAGISDTAAKFYYREKEASRKAAKRLRDKIAGWLSWAVFGHGEGWKRILFWIAGFVLFFTLIYFIIGKLTPDGFLDCLYYSAASFVALGYSSWVKESMGWAKGIGVTETFLGFFMMTLLLVTFVRKWTR